MTSPTVKLNTGYEIPIVGLGTWKLIGTGKQSVINAVNAGYRHIDCAYMYANEVEVGEAIGELIDNGTVRRESLFVTTKLWNTYHSANKVEEGFRKSLDRLGLKYIDLFLMHWTVGFQEGGDDKPLDKDGEFILSDVDYVETWKAMEKLVQQRLCRSIGLANFNSQQLKRVLDISEITPSVLQVECHPYLNQAKLLKFCKSYNIVLTAYSPLGAPARIGAMPEDPLVILDPSIIKIGKKYGKSPAQVCIRFQIQRGIVAIPKSATKSRIEENIQVFDFTLTDEDMDTIIDLGKINFRAYCADWGKSSKYFPFNIPF